jgi:hypothetical protein
MCCRNRQHRPDLPMACDLIDRRRVRNHYMAAFIATAGCNALDEPANAMLIETMQDLSSGGGDTADP